MTLFSTTRKAQPTYSLAPDKPISLAQRCDQVAAKYLLAWAGAHGAFCAVGTGLSFQWRRQRSIVG